MVFGKAAGFAPNLNLLALNGVNGFKLSGVASGDDVGHSVSSAGDVNGDGFDDLIVGASGVDVAPADEHGAAYVVFGKAGGFSSNLNLGTLNGTNGFKLSGAAAYDFAGRSVSSAGDVNGDGFADLLVGATNANGSFTGAAYVVFGKAGGFAANIDLVALTGANGFKLSGAAANDSTGISVSDAGDVNGDGFADLLVGAQDANGFSGAAYVVFGKAGGFAANIDLGALTGTAGFKLSGAAASDQAGYSVSRAGDVNGDGFADLLVGAFGADPNGGYSGATYLVFGKSGGFAANLDLGTLGAADGFRFSGAANDSAGISVSTAGDVNGDGFDDLLVGAMRASPNGSYSGASYTVFGRDFSEQVNFAGTTGNDSFIGTAAAEIALGGLGNDVLNGAGGVDVLRGGAGNDTLVFDGADRRVDGGAGRDTLRLDGAGKLVDLTTIPDTRITGIEQINLTGSGNNSLVLAATDLVNFSDTGNSLRVLGNFGDSIAAGLGWIYKGDIVVAADSFAQYVKGAAVLEMDTDIDRSAIGFSVNLGTAGFKLSGAAAYDQAGISVSKAGDVNGDGFDDLLVGAPYADPNGSVSGAAYLVFGKSGGFGTNVSLGTLNGVNGFRLSGAAADDFAGVAVSSAGDVNGDGFADLLVGAFGANGFSGATYVVFGHGGGFGADLNLGTLTGANGFRLVGAVAADGAGKSVANAGDVNGDGFDDLLVGAPYADPHGYASGAAYVVFGKSGGFVGDVNLGALAGADGFKLSGVAESDITGASVSGAGDVNGDGFDDILVGAVHADPHGAYSSGATYVVFGQSGGFAANLDLSTLDGSTGFRLSGATAGDFAGTSVSSAGDVNGDGFGDLLVGASTADANGTNSGAAYVVFGDSGGFAANLDLSALNGSNGFKLSGAAANNNAGISVSSAGDVNGDGFADLLVGTNGAGTYVVFGRTGGFAANLDLGTLTAADGFKLSGAAANDFAGNAVSKAGDVNGDGFDDLMVGAKFADPNGLGSGAAYTLFGRDFNGTAVKFEGTAANNTLTGTAAAENFVGGLGNDVMLLGGGADAARGGGGNDVIAAVDTSFRRLDGGAGTDTLRLDGAGMFLDLAGMPNLQVTGIENIDLNGTGANFLFLGAQDVLDLSQSTDTLRVRGGADDMVITPSEGWTPGELVTEGAVTYQSYSLGQATLLIETTLDRQVS